MTSFIYSSCLNDIIGGKINFENDQFKCKLMSEFYSPNKEMHADVGDLFGEASGPGYSIGGEDVEVGISQDSDKMTIILRGLTLNPSTLNATGAVYCTGNGNLVAYIDFGEKITSYNGPFTLGDSLLRMSARSKK